jgi:hypothetical protein
MATMKDNSIPHVEEKKSTKDMFKDLVDIFQSDNLNMKMILRNNITSIHMSRFDKFTHYFMRITLSHLHLASIMDNVDEEELVNDDIEWVHQVLGTIF